MLTICEFFDFFDWRINIFIQRRINVSCKVQWFKPDPNKSITASYFLHHPLKAIYLLICKDKKLSLIRFYGKNIYLTNILSFPSKRRKPVPVTAEPLALLLARVSFLLIIQMLPNLLQVFPLGISLSCMSEYSISSVSPVHRNSHVCCIWHALPFVCEQFSSKEWMFVNWET